MKILVVDDHAVVREGLLQLLKRHFPEVTFGEASDGESALKLIKTEAWDICLLDLNLKDMSGIDLLGELRAAVPTLPALVLSMHPEIEYGVRVLRAGAQGYVSKEAAPEVLIKAVKEVLSGKSFISPQVTQQLIAEVAQGKSRDPKNALLSERETVVMRLLCQGCQIKEIAAKLGISSKTVSTYRVRVLKKFKVGTNAELVQFAIKQGLLS